jgi:hypothetical protein
MPVSLPGRQAALLVLALFVAVPGPARAGDVTPADQSAFQSIITDQIEAFRRDDGEAAFAHASPGIRTLFQTSDRFLTMVRQRYAPVYRPRSYNFGVVTNELRKPTQRVNIVGPDGTAWVALYAMERQPDGSWRISSVMLIKPVDASV